MNYSTIKEFARTLRKNQTVAESIIWEEVRNRNFLGLKFTRQHVIQHSNIMGKKSFFIADFYCNEKKVIIEIDGEVHNTQIEYDEMRTEILEEMGYQLIRFRNEEVIAKLESLLLKLEQFTSRV